MQARADRVRIAAGSILAAILFAGCGEPAPMPNVLLVTADTLRPDYLGAYGFRGESSPSFDAYATRSVLFERAIAASSRTAPSHASLFTSRWVRDHSIGYRNGSTRLGDEPSLPELLAQAGYDTAAFIGNTMLRRRVGLDRGFSVFDDELPDSELNRDVFERVAEKTTPRAVEWLARERDAPFFLWVQYNDPHGPYTPPAPYVEPFAELDVGEGEPLPALEIQRGIGGIPAYQVIGTERNLSDYTARYAGEVRYFDAWFGRLLEAVETATGGRPLLVVVTADHGESLGEDGIYFSHGYATTPNLVHVPLLIHAPGISPRRIRTLVHHVDVLPTVLEWLGLPLPASIAGLSLVPLLTGADELPERTVFADVGAEVSAYRGDRFLRVRLKGDLGGTRAGSPVAYRWGRDGSWTPDSSAPDLLDHTLRYSTARAPMRKAEELESDDRKRLRALGYLE
jgi:arylsulfatase